MSLKSKMRAALFNEYGGPDVIQLSEVAIPEIGPEEVLIKVAATSYNPLDTVIRRGNFKNVISIEFPFIPHSDVSGVIEKVGESVESLRVGQKVYTYLDISRNGAAAEYVVSKAADKELAKEFEVVAKRMGVRSNAENLTQIAQLVDKGIVSPFITERFPLSEIRKVHELAGKTRGKVLIEVDSSL